jgi:cation:H+ antiporter
MLNMDILLYSVIFVVALAVLIKGADWFIESAEKIGLGIGISPYVIGVTIVAIGTSLPEMASSIAAIYQDESEIVMGNVVGSNITNILLVLGFVAVFGKSIRINADVINVDLPILILSAFLFFFMIWDGQMTMVEALLLLVGLVIFVVNTFQSGEEDRIPVEQREKITRRSIIFLILGGIGVYFGADYTIYAISQGSKIIGVTPDYIAITIVAFGTSLPELAVSLQAARRGNTGIAVGNVVGSNIFNTCAVAGIARLFGDLIIPANIIDFGLFFMIAVTISFGVMAWSNRITKWEGGILLVMYGFFIIELSKVLI